LSFHGYWLQVLLKQNPVEIEDKDTKPGQFKELIQHARKEGIRVIFVQPKFSSKSAKLVALEIEREAAAVDPLAENWSANLCDVANKFKAAFANWKNNPCSGHNTNG
jgi:zinc transport system substrate-binding protein